MTPAQSRDTFGDIVNQIISDLHSQRNTSINNILNRSLQPVYGNTNKQVPYCQLKNLNLPSNISFILDSTEEIESLFIQIAMSGYPKENLEVLKTDSSILIKSNCHNNKVSEADKNSEKTLYPLKVGIKTADVNAEIVLDTKVWDINKTKVKLADGILSLTVSMKPLEDEKPKSTKLIIED